MKILIPSPVSSLFWNLWTTRVTLVWIYMKKGRCMYCSMTFIFPLPGCRKRLNCLRDWMKPYWLGRLSFVYIAPYGRLCWHYGQKIFGWAEVKWPRGQCRAVFLGNIIMWLMCWLYLLSLPGLSYAAIGVWFMTLSTSTIQIHPSGVGRWNMGARDKCTRCRVWISYYSHPVSLCPGEFCSCFVWVGSEFVRDSIFSGRWKRHPSRVRLYFQI